MSDRLFELIFIFLGDDELIRKCILSGFFANVAKYHPLGEYRFVHAVTSSYAIALNIGV